MCSTENNSPGQVNSLLCELTLPMRWVIMWFIPENFNPLLCVTLLVAVFANCVQLPYPVL